MRQFETGATRNTDEGKYDYEAFMSPMVIERYAAYMHKNRIQANGQLRDGDNWQKGIPKNAYIKSAWRHFMDWWKEHRNIPTQEGIEQALCAILFNVMGYLHETLKEQRIGETPLHPEWIRDEAPPIPHTYRDWRGLLAEEIPEDNTYPISESNLGLGIPADGVYGRAFDKAWDEAYGIREEAPPFTATEISASKKLSLYPYAEAEYYSAVPGDAGLEHG